MIYNVSGVQQNDSVCVCVYVCVSIHWEENTIELPLLCFPGGSAGKESACSVGDLASIPGLGRSPGEGKGYLLQYSGLENSMDSVVHGVAESDTTE